jgi:hypothetical protein
LGVLTAESPASLYDGLGALGGFSKAFTYDEKGVSSYSLGADEALTKGYTADVRDISSSIHSYSHCLYSPSLSLSKYV